MTPLMGSLLSEMSVFILNIPKVPLLFDTVGRVLRPELSVLIDFLDSELYRTFAFLTWLDVKSL